MPDSYTHYHNANEALTIGDYTPRNYPAFIVGCNAPDIFYYYRKSEIFRKASMSNVSEDIHTQKTGLLIQNLFRLAETNAQKDFCLGWLCHYSLDSVMHPYVNYLTTAYAGRFNIDHGHAYFESALDSALSKRLTGFPAADPSVYLPDMGKMYFDQIITLIKRAVETTYPDREYDRSDYVTAFTDFKKIKKALYSPNGVHRMSFRIMEIILKLSKDYIVSRIQPAAMEICEVDVWRNNPLGFFSTDTLDDLLGRAHYLSADYLAAGLKYFDGLYSITDLLEDVGNKSYLTGLAID